MHRSDNSFAEFSMSIVKTTIKDGVIRWRSVNSDTGEDFYEERMSLELFKDMVKRIKDKEPFPEAFKERICEEGWCGGMPYVSLAHYKTGGAERPNVPGEVTSIYIDGDKLKSTGILYNNPLGNAVYKSLVKDFEEKRAEKKVRISIGFLDLEHSHGDKFTFTRRSAADKCPLCLEGVGDKIYKKGVLVHLALTRIPANPRTDMEVEKSVMPTKLEDLESIVEDPEVIKGLELKSLAGEDEVLVVRSDDKDADDKEKVDEDADEKKKKAPMAKEKSVASPDPVEVPAEVPAAPATPVVPAAPVAPVAPAEQTALQKSLANFENAVIEMKSKGVYGEDALRELQGSFDALAEVVRAEVAPAPKPIDPTNIESTLRSLLAELLPQAIAQSVAPLRTELSELRALSLAEKSVAPKKDFVPQPRSLQLDLTQRAAIEAIDKKPQSSFAGLANASVGLPTNFVR